MHAYSKVQLKDNMSSCSERELISCIYPTVIIIVYIILYYRLCKKSPCWCIYNSFTHAPRSLQIL